MNRVAKELLAVSRLVADAEAEFIDTGKQAAETFKCPSCGTKVLETTGYCVKCKKKVKQAAGELWQKVALKYGEEIAGKIHIELLKKASSFSNDSRLNPDDQLWVNDFMPALLDGLIAGIEKHRKRY